MSDSPSGPGWWLASDGKWYPPELAADTGGPGSDQVFESAGTQPTPARGTTDTVFPATDGTDSVFPITAGRDSVFAAASADAVVPSAGTDTVFPAAGGPDAVVPSAGTDTVFPAVGADAAPPTAGTDSVFATADAPPATFEYPTIQYPDTPIGAGISKSKIAAGVLAILLGWLGVHRFYLGYKGLGWTMLLLSLLSLGALIPITFVWGLVDGILILVGKIKSDKHGVPLK